MSTTEQLNTALDGRYRIEREIGAGGMATVYLAHDVKHERRVALKVLNPELGAVLGAERFLAEIRVTANLQHPNLLPLFDSGAAGGLLFYVMPFVEGESLRARLDREKQLPVNDAVHIASALASALDYAHAHGVIHRDLKPENVLMQAGEPVIADFGIALAVSNAGGARITQTGLSLGTPQYMSPEQATGDRQIDGRTDIYSLGAMLYEMLVGDPPHLGSTSQAIIAKVLTERPQNVRAARPAVPDHVAYTVERALEKLAADRWSSAREFAEALQGRMATASAMTASQRVAPHTRSMVERASPIVAAFALVAAAVLGVAWWRNARAGGARAGETVRFVATPVPAAGFVTVGQVTRSFAPSPDGRTLAFVGVDSGGTRRLFVRAIGEAVPRVIAGSEGAEHPTFSPNGEWLAFHAAGQLLKVRVAGGTPIPLTRVPGMSGATWTARDMIVYSSGSRLRYVSSEGGTGTALARDSTAADVDEWPLAVDEGNAIVYANRRALATQSSKLMFRRLDAESPVELGVKGTNPVAVLEGHLVFGNGFDALLAVPFDARTGTVTGTPRQVVSNVIGGSRANASASGTLMYRPGSEAGVLTAIDATGTATPLRIPPGSYSYPRYSPDGKRIAYASEIKGAQDIWVLDLVAGTSVRLTTEGFNLRPEWSPTGSHVLFTRSRDGGRNEAWWRKSDLSEPAQALAGFKDQEVWEILMAPDAATLLIRIGGVASADIYRRAVTGDTTRVPVAASEFAEYGPRVSPNGKWIAYDSDESGAREVWVRAFNGSGGTYRVSNAGGSEPLWTRDGTQIFYREGPDIHAVRIRETPSFTVTDRRIVWARRALTAQTGHADWDISPDGRTLLVPARTSGASDLVVAHNWVSELRAALRAAK